LVRKSDITIFGVGLKTVLEVEFSVTGMLRFVSHLELQHFFSRLALRAGLPVRFTQGFNPRPRISLPVPRTVGIRSLDDRVRIELEQEVVAEEALDRLRSVTPPDLDLLRAWRTDYDRLARVSAIEWRIDLAGRDARAVAERIDQVLGGHVQLPRQTKKHHRSYRIDVRPMILELSGQGDEVRARVAYSPQGSLRPGELLDILGLPRVDCLGRMTRVKTYWN
jgi:radical SAM-linked protein